MMNIGIGGRPKSPKRTSKTGRDRERARLLHELARQLVAERRLGGGAGDDDTGRGRDQQRRDLGDDTFTDRQQACKFCSDCDEREALLHDPDDEAADDVDEDDDQRGDRVAADELRLAPSIAP